MAIQCDGELIPITVKVKVGHNTPAKLTNFNPKPLLELEEFVIRENITLTISLEADDEANSDPNAFLELETHNEERSIKIGMGSTVDVFVYHEGFIKEFPFRVGYTNFKLVYKEQTHITLVEVIPIYLTTQQVNAIHNFLEKRIKNICYDFIEQSRLMEGIKMESPKWHHDYARFHKEHEIEIVMLFSRIRTDHLLKLSKLIKPSPVPAATNAKGIRMTLKKPYDACGRERFFTRSTRMTLDEELGRRLKRLLTQWLSRIESASKLIENELVILQRYCLNEENKKYHYLAKEKEFKNIKYVDKEFIIQVNNMAWAAAQRFKKYSRLWKIRFEWFDALAVIKKQIIYLLINTELSEIPSIPPKGNFRFKDRDLRQMCRLFEQSEELTLQRGSCYRVVSIRKPTWQIYEYYMTVTVLNILSTSNYGFKISAGFDQSLFLNIVEQGIPSGTAFSLENYTHQIRVVFDEALPPSEGMASYTKSAFYTSSKHNCPDLRIELYQLGSKKTCLGVLIIDAKHKKLTNICSDGAETENMRQLNDYFNIKCTLPLKDRMNR